MGRSTDSFGSAALSREEKVFAAHLEDMADSSARAFRPCFTFFLTERECAIADRVLSRRGEDCVYMLYGGCEGADRRMCGIFPAYSEPEESAFPLTAVRFSYRPEDKLTHRDFLGCFMGLQIERSLIGDILCSEGETIAVLSNTAAALAAGITKVGRVGVKQLPLDSGERIIRRDSFREITASVTSLRLDCVLAASLRLSREKAAALIRSSAVSVNHFPVESVSAVLKDGDILSVRGSGRFLLCVGGDLTKKGRIHITVKKYI